MNTSERPHLRSHPWDRPDEHLLLRKRLMGHKSQGYRVSGQIPKVRKPSGEIGQVRCGATLPETLCHPWMEGIPSGRSSERYLKSCSFLSSFL